MFASITHQFTTNVYASKERPDLLCSFDPNLIFRPNCIYAVILFSFFFFFFPTRYIEIIESQPLVFLYPTIGVMLTIAGLDWLTRVKEGCGRRTSSSALQVCLQRVQSCRLKPGEGEEGEDQRQSWCNKWVGGWILAPNEGLMYSHTEHSSWCVFLLSCSTPCMFSVVSVGSGDDPTRMVLFLFPSHRAPKTHHVFFCCSLLL